MHAAALPAVASDRPSSPSWAEIAAHRTYLVRFAKRRLFDPVLAEDAVHDVFEAVLSGRATFGGRAALRSWLTAVLKHKIVDTVRQRARHDSLDDDDDRREAPALGSAAPGPEEVAEQRQLLDRALVRIGALPPALRDVVRLRVLEDQSTASVCSTLGITEDNLFVRLHRARRQLAS
jgi:RNA polymerase sigma-70 factor (ECF subfamily)